MSQANRTNQKSTEPEKSDFCQLCCWQDIWIQIFGIIDSFLNLFNSRKTKFSKLTRAKPGTRPHSQILLPRCRHSALRQAERRILGQTKPRAAAQLILKSWAPPCLQFLTLFSPFQLSWIHNHGISTAIWPQQLFSLPSWVSKTLTASLLALLLQGYAPTPSSSKTSSNRAVFLAPFHYFSFIYLFSFFFYSLFRANTMQSAP